jgi:hypothetical protein
MSYTTEDEEFFGDEGIAAANERVGRLRDPLDDEEIKNMLETWKAPAAPLSLDRRVVEIYRIHMTAPLLRRVLSASIRVPLPLAAAVIGLLLVSGVSLVASRSSTTHETTIPGPVQIKVVEVPVIHEKIVSRAISANRRPSKVRVNPRTDGRYLTTIRKTDKKKSDKKTSQDEGDSGRYFTHADLSGFQPMDQVKIEVIRRRINEN